MHNRAFWRALHSLTHPITISAIALLIINDHYLKQNHPSWWTGKLSDFAGLVFAPLIFATLLAWLIRSHVRHQEKLVGSIAFVLTGLVFTLTKTLSQMNHATTEFWEFFAGGSVKMWLDPTDLLALPALLIGWFIWQGSSNHAMRVALPALTLIAIGSLAATATSCLDHDRGIDCLRNVEGHLYAFAISDEVQRVYSSENGQTWQLNEWTRNTPTCSPRTPSWTIQYPEESNAIYKFQTHQYIKVSEDGGDSWQEAIDLRWHTSRDRIRGLGRSNEEPLNICSYTIHPGPHDAIFFKETGQLFVAMGLDGLLVMQPNGEWEWVKVGPYHLAGVATLDMDFLDLWPQLLMSLGAAALTLVLIGQYLVRSCEAVVAVTFAWIMWAISMTKIHLTPFASENVVFDISSTATTWLLLGFLPLTLGSLALTILQIKNAHPSQVRKPITIITLASFLACFLPYVRWLGNFDDYLTTTYQAIFLVIVTQVVGFIFIRNKFPRAKLIFTAASPPSADHPK